MTISVNPRQKSYNSEVLPPLAACCRNCSQKRGPVFWQGVHSLFP